MTNAEAIETLRANYPDACFEQLRCAVDMAINALTKEAWKEEHPVSPLLQKLATNLQPSKQDADDTISRKAAIDALMEFDKKLRKINWYQYPYTEHECRGVDEAIVKIANLPSAQPDIIRCSECKFYTEIRPDLNTGICDLACRHLGGDGFCSEAERRTDE